MRSGAAALEEVEADGDVHVRHGRRGRGPIGRGRRAEGQREVVRGHRGAGVRVGGPDRSVGEMRGEHSPGKKNI